MENNKGKGVRSKHTHNVRMGFSRWVCIQNYYDENLVTICKN